MNERVSRPEESIRRLQCGAAFLFTDRVVALVNRTTTEPEIVVASDRKPMGG